MALWFLRPLSCMQISRLVVVGAIQLLADGPGGNETGPNGNSEGLEENWRGVNAPLKAGHGSVGVGVVFCAGCQGWGKKSLLALV